MNGGGVGEVLRQGDKSMVAGKGSVIDPGAMDDPHSWTLDQATVLLQSLLLL